MYVRRNIEACARNHCCCGKAITYLLTPWCRVLLEKLTGLQLVKKFPAFYGTRRFITALTSFRHLSLSWTSPIQCTYPHPTSWRSIPILSTHLRLGLPSDLFPSGFPTKNLALHIMSVCLWLWLPGIQSLWAVLCTHMWPIVAVQHLSTLSDKNTIFGGKK